MAAKCPRLANRANAIFHRDNARPRVAGKNVKRKSREFSWEILSFQIIANFDRCNGFQLAKNIDIIKKGPREIF